ncbi:septal ring lytic transglycosylase RlpA family lipoprotein [Asaia sp. W19]|uniref:septal ring lytic transglycosylase RlpA family protein n=1 Tax=unclassified Asaia TaxID=2685023 RepID=UPI000F8DE387|nr:septal ring lytic transglycosylase RlpA family protein [Asaia sp. W19]RUT25240.1 septal ring lytic transglycosylase RlpA family lipoprotein [Asaia sp. W19]
MRLRARIGGLALLCTAFAPKHGAHAATASQAAPQTTIVTEPSAENAPWASSVRLALAKRAHRIALASHNVLSWSEHGVASWYGRRLAGHRTSSGERLDGQALTAAHPTLPMGSKVLVENEDTGRSVIVTVNDRGPFNSRIIDLSHAAAAEIGMLGSGTAHVKIAPIPADTAIKEDQPLEVAEAEAEDTNEQALDAVTPVVKPHARRAAPTRRVHHHK